MSEEEKRPTTGLGIIGLVKSCAAERVTGENLYLSGGGVVAATIWNCP